MDRAMGKPPFVTIPSCAGRGIYLLLYRGDAVYVGKSACNLFARLGRHMRDKQFDEIKWHQLKDDEDIDAIERGMIQELRPVYNSMHK